MDGSPTNLTSINPGSCIIPEWIKHNSYGLTVFHIKITELVKRPRYNYGVTDCIGKGTMGMVYKAKVARECDDKYVTKYAAVKTAHLSHELLIDAEKSLLLTKRLEYLVKLDHPNVALYHNAIITRTLGGICIEVPMEYFSGGDLVNYIESLEKNGGRLGLNLALDFAIDCVSALNYLHENDIVHGDIKMRSLLLRWYNENRPKAVLAGLDGIATILPSLRKRSDGFLMDLRDVEHWTYKRLHACNDREGHCLSRWHATNCSDNCLCGKRTDIRRIGLIIKMLTSSAPKKDRSTGNVKKKLKTDDRMFMTDVYGSSGDSSNEIDLTVEYNTGTYGNTVLNDVSAEVIGCIQNCLQDTSHQTITAKKLLGRLRNAREKLLSKKAGRHSANAGN